MSELVYVDDPDIMRNGEIRRGVLIG